MTIHLDTPEQIIAEITRLSARPCACPCHWFPAVAESGRCCGNAGLARTTDGFEPWPDEPGPEDEDEPEDTFLSGPWFASGGQS